MRSNCAVSQYDKMICGWIIGNGLVEKLVACSRYCPSVDCTKPRQSPVRLVSGQDSIPVPHLQCPARCDSCNLLIMHQESRAEEEEWLLETTTEEAFNVGLSLIFVNSSCKDWVKPETFYPRSEQVLPGHVSDSPMLFGRPQLDVRTFSSKIYLES